MVQGPAAMVFRLTRKLAEKLKLGRLPHTDGLDAGSVWHGNLFRVGGVQYILLTESLTLFSVLLHGRGIVDQATFVEAAIEQIHACFRQRGWLPILGGLVSFDRDGATLLSAQDRSILSSMNEIVRIMKWQIANRPGDLNLNIKEMNDIPLTRNGVMDQPVRRVQSLVRAGLRSDSKN